MYVHVSNFVLYINTRFQGLTSHEDHAASRATIISKLISELTSKNSGSEPINFKVRLSCPEKSTCQVGRASFHSLVLRSILEYS